MRRIFKTASVFGSLICAAGTLGMATPRLHAQTSPQIEAWRELMMQPRTKTVGCYTANYPSTQWMKGDCPPAPAFSAPVGQEPRVTTPVHPMDESTQSDYVAYSEGSISSGTGTLSIDNNYLADGFGSVPNEFSIQLNTNHFVSVNPKCSQYAGCFGWAQFLIDSGGSIQIQDWLLGFLKNAANEACPEGYSPYGGSDCMANLGYMKLPTIPPFLAFSGVKLTGDTSLDLDSITMFLPGGLLMQGVISDREVGLYGKWNVAEFNTFGNSNGDETGFNPGTYVDAQLALTDGTTSAPVCRGGYSYTAETTNLVLGACMALSSPSHGIQFEEAVPPYLHTVTPNFGPASGGTTIHLNGEGFTSKMQAIFGSTAVPLTNCTGTDCTVVTPPGQGIESLSVVNLGMQGTPLASSSLTSPQQFTYKAAPYGSMSPSVGTSSTTVTISGNGFDTAANTVSVTFLLNGVAVPASSVVCSSTTSCTMHPPSKPTSVSGAVTVPATMIIDGKAISIGSFEYLAGPTGHPTPPPCRGTCI